MKINEVKNYLSQLTKPELAELLYDIFKKQNTGSLKMVLAEICFSAKDSPASISVVALPWEANTIASSDRDDFVNFGTCAVCRIDVTSWPKDAICPVCGSKVGLT